MLLMIAMLSLLIAFFALFAGLVGFAAHVIQPRAEAAGVELEERGGTERTPSRSAAP